MQITYIYHSFKFSVCRSFNLISVPKAEDLLIASFQMAEMLDCLCHWS